MLGRCKENFLFFGILVGVCVLSCEANYMVVDSTTEEFLNTTTTRNETFRWTTSPIARTAIVPDDGETPPFMGWPELNTEPATQPPPIIEETAQPAGTISCPYCYKIKNSGVSEVRCRESRVWCNQYQGCWYFTGDDDLMTKGCMDIIPKEVGIAPKECTDFYKRGICLQGHCVSCDFYGLGGTAAIRPNNWIIIFEVFILLFSGILFINI